MGECDIMNFKRLTSIFTVVILIFSSLSLSVFAEVISDELYDTGNQQKIIFWIQVIIGVLIVGVIIILLIKNRNVLLGRNSNRSATAPLDEDKVSDKIRLFDPAFKRDEFKEYAGKALIEVLSGINSKSITAIRPYESDYLYNIHEKQIKEYIETRKTNHYTDIKIVSTELASYEDKENITDRLTVRINVSMFDYTTDDTTNGVIDGSKLARRNRIYKAEFIRAKTFLSENGYGLGNICPICSAQLIVTSTGKCSECKAVLGDGSHGWLLDSLTKWSKS